MFRGSLDGKVAFENEKTLASHRERFASFLTFTLDHKASVFRLHASTEPMSLLATTLTRLICAFHIDSLQIKKTILHHPYQEYKEKGLGRSLSDRGTFSNQIKIYNT